MKRIGLLLFTTLLLVICSCEEEKPTEPLRIEGEAIENISGIWESEDASYFAHRSTSRTTLNLSASTFSFVFESKAGDSFEKSGAMSGVCAVTGSSISITVQSIGMLNTDSGSFEIFKSGESDEWINALTAMHVAEDDNMPYSINDEQLSITIGGQKLNFTRK